MKSLADCRLYAFIDTAYFHGRAPEVFAQQLCDGGADLIQLRAKKSTPDEVRRMAEAILPVTRRRKSAWSSTTIRKSPAKSARNSATWARRIFLTPAMPTCPEFKIQSSTFKIGLSTHSPEQAESALAAGPDYIAIGPVYSTRHQTAWRNR